MSLLNDMLQDLQQQPHKDNEASNENYRAQLNESGMIKTTSVPWLVSGLVFVVVLLILLVFKYQFISNDHKDVASEIEVAQVVHGISADVVEDSEKLIAPLQEPVSQTLSDTDTEYPAQATTPLQKSPAQQVRIDELLALARQAIARDRLTSPLEDNAYSYYREILSIEPDNPFATQGILQLADRYLAMADKKLAVGNMASANSLLQRAQLVAPDYPAVVSFGEMLQVSMRQADPEQQQTLQENTTNPEQTQTVTMLDNKPSLDKAGSSYRVRDPFEVNAEDTHLSVTHNAQWLDQQQVHKAKLLLQQSKTAQAITALEQFIASNQSPIESTRMLLEIYCEQGRVEDAQALLSSAAYLEKADDYYFKARLALINNQNQEAMVLLETGLPEAEKRETYRALLAGVYQKTAYYSQAASSYKRLLEVFGDKPAYWLGYALALDAMEQTASALQAYQRLSEYTELQVEVRQYIEQRIAALQS